jgi:hypothetical protein
VLSFNAGVFIAKSSVVESVRESEPSASTPRQYGLASSEVVAVSSLTGSDCRTVGEVMLTVGIGGWEMPLPQVLSIGWLSGVARMLVGGSWAPPPRLGGLPCSARTSLRPPEGARLPFFGAHRVDAIQ